MRTAHKPALVHTADAHALRRSSRVQPARLPEPRHPSSLSSVQRPDGVAAVARSSCTVELSSAPTECSCAPQRPRWGFAFAAVDASPVDWYCYLVALL